MLNRKRGDRVSYRKRFYTNKRLVRSTLSMFGQRKGFLQISFAWLFAIIIGAIILFFAIYFSVRLINTEETISSTEAGKEIAVLLHPLETGFGEERSTPLAMAVESRINNGCEEPEEFNRFGKQEISVSQKISGRWTDSGIEQVFYNKYIFSNRSAQGKDFYLFSKPFEFPFKVADLIFLTSAEDNYCFADAPEEIREELANFGQANLLTENCPTESTNVCFDSEENTGGSCDIFIDEGEHSVIKDEETVYYETDALMYAAIFSGADLYECHMKRLMQRLESLALVYNEKESVLVNVGCIAEVSLLGLADSASSLESSADLINVASAAEDAKNSNENAYCELW